MQSILDTMPGKYTSSTISYSTPLEYRIGCIITQLLASLSRKQASPILYHLETVLEQYGKDASIVL